MLPDVAWVKILSYLDMKDRARLAVTCHTLNDVFNHPSLWHTVSNSKLCDNFKMNINELHKKY